MLTRLAPAWGDDWWFQGSYAFAHHELDLLDDARRLAERSLEQHPRNAAGAHPLAHVFFESNDHAGGAAFLADWIAAYDRRGPVLLPPELAPGPVRAEPGQHPARPGAVRRRDQPGRRRSPYHAGRLGLAALALPDLRLRAEGRPALGATSARTPARPRPTPGDGVPRRRTPPWRSWRWATPRRWLGSIAGLEALAGPSRPLVAEVVLPLARGLEAFGQGGYDEAIRWLEPLDGQLVRVGGSHAQWEVFEDTLLQAYLRAGRSSGPRHCCADAWPGARQPATSSGWSRPRRARRHRRAHRSRPLCAASVFDRYAPFRLADRSSGCGGAVA